MRDRSPRPAGRRHRVPGIFREDNFDPAAAHALPQNLDEQRDGVARAVGAAAVEGPETVADSAEYAANDIEVLASRLRDWLASIVSGEDREELVQSQLTYAREDQLTMLEQVGRFTAECRKVLHPAESRRPASIRSLIVTRPSCQPRSGNWTP